MRFSQPLIIALTLASQVAAGAASTPAAAPSSPAAAASTSEISIDNAWIRALPGGLPAAGYLRIRNRGAKPVYLLAASSPDYGSISLHRTIESGGVSQMQPQQKIRIAAHSSVDFAASGYHLMLMQPHGAKQPGSQVSVTLNFDGAPQATVPFEVRRANGAAMSKGKNDMGDMKDMPGMQH